MWVYALLSREYDRGLQRLYPRGKPMLPREVNHFSDAERTEICHRDHKHVTNCRAAIGRQTLHEREPEQQTFCDWGECFRNEQIPTTIVEQRRENEPHNWIRAGGEPHTREDAHPRLVPT